MSYKALKNRIYTAMNYDEAINFLFTQLPMYQRSGAAAYKDNLENTLKMDSYFGHPHLKFRSIHVAGTNGKGSVSHLLASVLQEAGYRTGLYTSPHLVDFRERIRVNGEMIPQDRVVDFVVKHGQLIDEIGPSFFEMTVAMAFDYFAKEEVEVAVVEVGLGGRLDSTNIINPMLSVITNIGMDHVAILGDSLRKIASEKAGIIKEGVPVVIGKRQESCAVVFSEKAKELNAPVSWAGDKIRVEQIAYANRYQLVDTFREEQLIFEKVKLPLAGPYQSENLATVIASLEELRKGGLKIDDESILKGIEGVIGNTGLQGRWQVLSDKPLTICDTGHNEDGIRSVMSQLLLIPASRLHIVIGMVSDKDVDNVLRLFPSDATYYFTRASIPRSLAPELLRDAGAVYGLKGSVYADVKSAIAAARENAADNDLIFIGGSTFVVAEAI